MEVIGFCTKKQKYKKTENINFKKQKFPQSP